MEKQLLKRLALSVLVVSSVAQAQEGNKEEKMNVAKVAAVAAVPVVALGAMYQNEIGNAASSAAKTVGSYVPERVSNGLNYVTTGVSSGLNTVADCTYRTEAAKTVGNVVADYSYRTRPAQFVADYTYRLAFNDSKSGVKAAANEATRKAVEAADVLKAATQRVDTTKAALETLTKQTPEADKLELHTNRITNAQTQYDSALKTQEAALAANAKAAEAVVTAVVTESKPEVKAEAPKTEAPAPVAAPAITEVNNDVITVEEAAALKVTEAPAPVAAPKVEAPVTTTQTQEQSTPAPVATANSGWFSLEGWKNTASATAESVSNAWKNNSYYNNYAVYGLGTVAAGYGAYKLSKIAYAFATKPSAITIESVLKNVTTEELKKAQPEVVTFGKALDKIVATAFAELGQGQAGKSMKSADEIFTLTISKENPLLDIMTTQQTLMKNAYSEVKGLIEQWQKDKTGYAPSRVTFGSLYSTKVNKTLNEVVIALNAKIATK